MERISYSKLETFKQCKQKYEFKYILKLPDPGNKYSKEGTDIHKEIEEFISGISETLPNIPEKSFQYISDLRNTYNCGGCSVELKVEATIPFGVGYSFLGYIDYIQKKNPDKIRIIDFKTGKKRDFTKQLKLYSYILFINDPELMEVAGEIFYVKINQSQVYTFTRDATISEIQTDLIAGVKALESCTTYSKNRSPLCGFCAYTEECLRTPTGDEL